MAKVIVGGYPRQEGNATEDSQWRLIKTIEVKTATPSIVIGADEKENPFNCKEILISSKIIANTASKPMCKINGDTVFSGVGSVYANGTRYCYDAFTLRGFFIERDMKYSTQNILDNSVLFDNGFLRIIKKEIDSIKSIEYYGDSTSFTFKAGTIIEVYGR